MIGRLAGFILGSVIETKSSSSLSLSLSLPLWDAGFGRLKPVFNSSSPTSSSCLEERKKMWAKWSFGHEEHFLLFVNALDFRCLRNKANRQGRLGSKHL